MGTEILDENIYQVLEAAIATGDNYQLFDCFLSDGSCLAQLGAIFNKLGHDIYTLIEALPEKEPMIFNVLQILLDLIQAYGISTDTTVALLKPVLFLAVNEKCSVHTLKRAVTIFNSLLQTPVIISSVVTDDYLEGSLQILGRKVPSIGDYECQALVFEALFRLTCEQNREYWVNIWFSDPEVKAMILNLDPQQFESSCRKVLNYINKLEPDRRVFSFTANTVSFGSMQLNKPDDCDFWVDFNYDTQSISFFCSELESKEQADDSSLWETVLISTFAVKSYDVIIQNDEKVKNLIIELNCPCHSLITSSSITSPARESYVVTLSFWSIYDILQHVKRIYGKDKYIKSSELGKRKSSDSYQIPINNELSENQTFNHDTKRRKVSNTSETIKIMEEDTYAESSELKKRKSSKSYHIPVNSELSENQTFNHDTKRRKISNTSETIKIMEEVSEVFSSEIFSQRKVSNTIDPIIDAACDTEECSKEIFSQQMIANLSEPISVGLQSEAKDMPGTQEYRRRSSNSVDAIVCDLNVDGIINENANKEMYLSPKEADVTKPATRKIIRLYNLEKAPVFKGPFTRETNKQPAENENTRLRYFTQNDYNSDTRRKPFETFTTDVNVSKSPVPLSRSNRASPDADLNKKNAENDKIKHYDQFPLSDEDFEPNTDRVLDRRVENINSNQVHLDKQKQKPNRKRISKSSYSSPTENLPVQSSGSCRKLRKAAAMATRKNKKIFDEASEVVFEKSDTFTESNHRKSMYGSEKKKKHLKTFHTDTETGSSEVSWLNKNKSFSLFETPRKSYSEWKRKKNEKRKLPIKVIPDEYSIPKQHSSKRQKKPNPKVLSIDSGSKNKSFHWSDLDNFDLTIEKAKKRGSDNFMKDLEYNLTSSTKKNISKKSSKRGPKSSTPKPDIKLSYPLEEFVSDVTMAENVQTDDLNYYCKENNIPINSSQFNLSQPVNISLRVSSSEHNSPINMEGKNIAEININKNNFNCAKSKVLSHIYNEDKGEDNVQGEKIMEDSGIQAPEDEIYLLDEFQGKNLLLRSFLEDVSDYLQTSQHKSLPSLNKSESGISSMKRKPSSDFNESSKKIKVDVYDICENEEHSQTKSSNPDLHGLNNKPNDNNARFKPIESEVSMTNQRDMTHRKQKSVSSVKQYNNLQDVVPLNDKPIPVQGIQKFAEKSNLSAVKVDNLCSRLTTNSSLGMKRSKFMGSSKSTLKSTTHTKSDANPSNLAQKLSKKEKSKSVDVNSVDFLYSSPSTKSLFDTRKDKWFEDIVSELSQNTNALTRKLLATVQKYVCEYYVKMSVLRWNISEAAQILKASDKVIDQSQLKNQIKNCRNIREEVELSLKKMHHYGYEYFDAEQENARKLKKKHIKAGVKYVKAMKDAVINSTNKLDRSVLCQTNYFLKKLLKRVNCA